MDNDSNKSYNSRTYRIERSQNLIIKPFIFPIVDSANGSVININWEGH